MSTARDANGAKVGLDDSAWDTSRSKIGQDDADRSITRQEATGTMALKHSRRGGESLKGLTARYDRSPFGSKKQWAKREKANRKEADEK